MNTEKIMNTDELNPERSQIQHEHRKGPRFNMNTENIMNTERSQIQLNPEKIMNTPQESRTYTKNQEHIPKIPSNQESSEKSPKPIKMDARSHSKASAKTPQRHRHRHRHQQPSPTFR
ncbi:hypothetical protein Hanom_Chr16g01451751 [Helianthus anomalus]